MKRTWKKFVVFIVAYFYFLAVFFYSIWKPETMDEEKWMGD